MAEGALALLAAFTLVVPLAARARSASPHAQDAAAAPGPFGPAPAGPDTFRVNTPGVDIVGAASAEAESAAADTATSRSTADRVTAGPATAADSTLDDFLGGLSDSTDRYFGLSAAPVDTAGNDSALVYALEHPRADRASRLLRLGVRPDFAFNRVDGPVWGGELHVGRPDGLGRIFGELGYAAGPNNWLGGGGYRRSARYGNANWSLELFGGRRTAVMDRDLTGRYLASMSALFTGRDYRRYYRRDGFQATLERETQTWRAGAGYRDMLESALQTTTTWNFARRDPVVIGNLPAAFGRARELELHAAWRLPRVPVTAEVAHQTSGKAIGSDFEYRRTRVSMSGNFGLGSIASLVPQVEYGRLTESPVPQEAFYLGGARTLRSLPGASRGGTGIALARLDVIGTTDVLAWAHVPHPAAFPIQAGLFAATGAVWGPDPYGGPAVRGHGWPRANSWLSEAGASLIYQPGLPDPASFVRLDFAQPLGPARERTRWTLSYTRALDLVRPFEP
jgi:hypothetical protein